MFPALLAKWCVELFFRQKPVVCDQISVPNVIPGVSTVAQTSLIVQNSCVIVCGILLMVVFQFREQLVELYNGWILVRSPMPCLYTLTASM